MARDKPDIDPSTARRDSQPNSIDTRTDKTGINRRGWLNTLGIGATVAIAGCLSDDGDSGPAGDNDEDDESATGPEPLDLSQEPPAVDGEYHVVQATSFDTINPVFNTEDGAGDAIDLVLDQGYTFDANNDLFPLLFEDISTSDGGKTWTIRFRDGLEFSDPYGQYTAEDYVYFVQEIHQADWVPSANSADWNGVQIEQTGELEAQATLDNSSVIWPQTFAPLEYPIPKGLLEPYVEAEDAEGLEQDAELLDLSFAGNLGPYRLDTWIRDGGTEYTRNESYYLRVLGEQDDYRLFSEAPYFETARIEIIEEEASRIAAIETGNTDNVSLPPDRGQEFIEDDDTMVVLEPTPFNDILSVNMRDNGWTHGPGNLFRITEFRQAIAASIDTTEYIDGIASGFADEHYTWQPEFSEWFPGRDDLTLWGNPVDGVYGEDARDLAEEALEQVEEDYAYDGDVLVGPNGNQVELQLYYNAASDTEELAAEFFGNELEEHLGLTLDTNAVDTTTFSENYWSTEPEGGTDVIDGEEVEWNAPTPDNPGPRSVTSDESWDLSTVFGLNTFPRNPLTNDVFFDGANGFYNPVGYYPEFDTDAVFDRMRNAESRDELREAAEELFVNLNEEQPYIMIAFGVDIEAYNPTLRGPIEDFSSDWNQAVWYTDE